MAELPVAPRPSEEPVWFEFEFIGTLCFLSIGELPANLQLCSRLSFDGICLHTPMIGGIRFWLDWNRCHCGTNAHPIGLCFHGGVLDDRHPTAKRIPHASRALLNHMRQFVTQQSLSVMGSGAIESRCEIDA